MVGSGLGEICENCEDCGNNKNPSELIVGFSMSTAFNKTVAMDVGRVGRN